MWHEKCLRPGCCQCASGASKAPWLSDVPFVVFLIVTAFSGFCGQSLRAFDCSIVIAARVCTIIVDACRVLCGVGNRRQECVGTCTLGCSIRVWRVMLSILGSAMTPEKKEQANRTWWPRFGNEARNPYPGRLPSKSRRPR